MTSNFQHQSHVFQHNPNIAGTHKFHSKIMASHNSIHGSQS